MYYEIGGFRVFFVSKKHADAWNNGTLTPSVIDSTTVFSLGRLISLRRASNERLEPISARAMRGKPAILVEDDNG